MNNTDKSSAATEALEALERELASASDDVTKELSLLTSVIDQRQEEERKERESQVHETRKEPEPDESSQVDLEEKPREPQPTPAEVDPPRTQTEGRNFAGWPKKDQSVHHKHQREIDYPFLVSSGLEALFFFSLLGPGLIFIYLMVALLTVDPFPFRIN